MALTTWAVLYLVEASTVARILDQNSSSPRTAVGGLAAISSRVRLGRALRTKSVQGLCKQLCALQAMTT